MKIKGNQSLSKMPKSFKSGMMRVRTEAEREHVTKLRLAFAKSMMRKHKMP